MRFIGCDIIESLGALFRVNESAAVAEFFEVHHG